MSEWKTYTMEEVIEHFIDYRGKTPKKTTYGIPLITAKIVKNGFIAEPDEFIAEDYYDSWMRRGLPEIGDVVMTTEAPLGEVAQIKTSAKIALGQRIITLRGKPDLLDNTFLRFLLQGATVQGRLKARGTGSTVQGIKSSELKKVQIELPPLDEQIKIASVLGNIDDKIELNRRMNKTLEAMAMTLYRHYFIDFGLHPNAKYEADECPYGKLVETDEMGPVPEGWRVETFYEIANIMGGGTPKTQKDDYWNGDIPFFTPKDYASSLYIFSTEKNITQHGLDNCNSKLYPINTIFITARGTVGNICLAGKAMAMNQSCYALKHKNSDMNYFLYLSLRNAISRLYQISHGSVFNTITTDTFKMLYAVIAPSDIMIQFHEKVNNLFKQIFLNENETQTLLQARTYLLAKLISGEVRVQ